MFKFGKSKNKNKVIAKPLTDQKIEDRIHVMPPRFYIEPKKSQWGLIIIIIVGILVIIGLAVMAVYLNESLKNRTDLSNVANTNADLEVNTNTNVNSPSVNLNTNVATSTGLGTTNTNTNTDIPTSTNTNVNTNVNAGVNTNVNISQPIQPLPFSVDSDNDTLTDVEESLYGTDSQSGDSDGDGFKDGSELVNGYDPTRPGLTLEQSGLFDSYSGPGYSIRYPRSWIIQERDPDQAEVLFLSDIGEFVEVLAVANNDNLPLAAWLVKNVPELNLSQSTVLNINGFEGFRNPNLRSYYLMKPDQPGNVYLVSYNVGNAKVANFLTTFNVMVKNFKPLP
ncbi:MAG: thrombospondin type 3 repeat-containing protein [Patescibacteria group bacterium]|jgi:hypothetical protein|nr:thrombospondin type 3 repeat-containing protein [Patescibacteria group bacterium]